MIVANKIIMIGPERFVSILNKFFFLISGLFWFFVVFHFPLERKHSALEGCTDCKFQTILPALIYEFISSFKITYNN